MSCLNLTFAVDDLKRSVEKIKLIHYLAINDIKQRYRRTILGPLWITISIAATILGLGLLFGVVFNKRADNYISYLAVGVIFWTFISSSINEGAESLLNSERIIKQISLPYTLYVLRVLYRNFIILIHNISVLIIIFICLGKNLFHPNFFAFIQFILGILNLFWIILLLAILSARYRDITPIVSNALQLLFYMTPIIWQLDQIQQSLMLQSIVYLNPMYYLIISLRGLIEGNILGISEWTFSLLMLIFGWGVTIIIFSRVYKRLALWI